MQPNARTMGLPACSAAVAASQIPLLELQNGDGQPHFVPCSSAHDDFFDQMLSAVPSWPDLPKSTWDLAGASVGKPLAGNDGLHFPPAFDESSQLASRLRQYQISGGSGSMPTASGQHHQQVLLSTMAARVPAPAITSAADSVSSFKSLSPAGGDDLFSGFGGASLRQPANPPTAAHFVQPQTASVHHQSFGGAPPQATSVAASAGGGTCPPRQRVRARRGQATDPHSIAERLRRERIAERMKALQELVPNANKTDKASMLDEIIDYVKFLQLQVKVLSMSRLGGTAAVGPLVAEISSERWGSSPATTAAAAATAASESMTAAEHQVAKLMEEDMGSAMQYLQGKGLCLMPISLASAISTATCRLPSARGAGGLLVPGPPAVADAPPSPSLSVLTVHSAAAANTGAAAAAGDTAVSQSSSRDAASVSKP